MTLPDFLTQDSAGYVHLSGHRIGLQDIVFFYNEGYTPEMLLGQFPTLILPLINQVIAFYQENQTEVDAYLSRCEAVIAQQRAQAQRGPTLEELRQRYQSRRHATGA